MGLYLCIFDGNEELDGVDVGSYEDFNYFRNAVTEFLEGGNPGSRYPTLIIHSDCDGEWNPIQCAELEDELQLIASAFQDMPPVEFRAEWQKSLAKTLSLQPQNLYQSFIDVDGEPLLDRLLALCQIARERRQPILFQ